jgi:hypothetical protein
MDKDIDSPLSLGQKLLQNALFEKPSDQSDQGWRCAEKPPLPTVQYTYWNNRTNQSTIKMQAFAYSTPRGKKSRNDWMIPDSAKDEHRTKSM